MSTFTSNDYTHLVNLAKQDSKGKLAGLKFNIELSAPVMKQMDQVLKYYNKRSLTLPNELDLDKAVDFFMLFHSKTPITLMEKLEGSEIDPLALFGKQLTFDEAGTLDDVVVYIYKKPDETYHYLFVNKTNKVKQYNNKEYFYKIEETGKYSVAGKNRCHALNLSTLTVYCEFMTWLRNECNPLIIQEYVKNKDEFSLLLNIFARQLGRKKTIVYYQYRAIFEAFVLNVMNKHIQYVSFVTTQKFQNEATKKYAKAFETKSYIKQETQNVMGTTMFLKNFTYVELDNEVDLDKFNEVNAYYAEFSERFAHLLPTHNDNTVLRIRKLGNYRAAGIYFEMLQTVAIDLRHMDSFVHEIGHFNDARAGRISLTPEFIADVVVPFTREFSEHYKIHKHISISMYNYYVTASEVFARAFELYFKYSVLDGGNSMFVQPREVYETEPHYQYLLENLDVITKYMGAF